MDPEDFGYLEIGERKGRIFFGGSERRKISGTCSANRERRPRDRKPHLLSSESGAGVAGAYPAGIERDTAAYRKHYRPRDDAVSSALRRRHATVADERIDAVANRAGTELSRGARKYRSAGLGEAGRGHHFATREAAAARWQHYSIARCGR